MVLPDFGKPQKQTECSNLLNHEHSKKSFCPFQNRPLGGKFHWFWTDKQWNYNLSKRKKKIRSHKCVIYYLNSILVQGPVRLEQPAFPLLPPQSVVRPVLRSLCRQEHKGKRITAIITTTLLLLSKFNARPKRWWTHLQIPGFNALRLNYNILPSSEATVV